MDLYQQFIHKSRYSRYIDEKQRREHWDETVDRYVQFISDSLYKNHEFKISESLKKEIRGYILDMKVMPSMRAMMTAGLAAERQNMATFNCSFLPIDDIKCFDELMYILLCVDPETIVQTSNGNKPIKDIDPNVDMVLTLNEQTGQFEYQYPLGVFESRTGSDEDVVVLQLDDGSEIKCTANHEVLTKNRGWVKAIDLTEEDEL